MTEHEHPNDWLRAYIKEIPDFPQRGINFRDIIPLLADKTAFQHVVQKLSDRAWSMNAEAVVAIESRGFIFAAPVAFSLGIPFVPVRKKGKLPGKTVSVRYDLEYGSGELEMPQGALVQGANVVIIDDVLATGGTARAANALVQLNEASTVGFLFVLELMYLNGKAHLGSIPHHSLLQYS